MQEQDFVEIKRYKRKHVIAFIVVLIIALLCFADWYFVKRHRTLIQDTALMRGPQISINGTDLRTTYVIVYRTKKKDLYSPLFIHYPQDKINAGGSRYKSKESVDYFHITRNDKKHKFKDSQVIFFPKGQEDYIVLAKSWPPEIRNNTTKLENFLKPLIEKHLK